MRVVAVAVAVLAWPALCDGAPLGAMSCDFDVDAGFPLDQAAVVIERDRIHMSKFAAPNMLHKHVPFRFGGAEFIEGGGRYLFADTASARDYRDFVVNTYALGGLNFGDQPHFHNLACNWWEVIDHDDTSVALADHVAMRSERYQATGASGDPVRRLLHQRWSTLLSEASARGYAAVQLHYHARLNIVQVVIYVERLAPPNPAAPDPSLVALEADPPLGEAAFGDQGWSRYFDRTQWVMSTWHPYVSGDAGTPSDWPNSPPMPELVCGDGLCVPSRGEDGTSCPDDCAPQCGDAICQAGEDEWACPSDCEW